MKTKARSLGVLIAAIITFTLTGCGTTKEVVVNEAPPPPQQETLTAPPSVNSLWVAGHWVRRDNQWAWQNGRWMMRPSANAYWEPGEWDHSSRGWIWHDGQWRDAGIH